MFLLLLHIIQGIDGVFSDLILMKTKEIWKDDGMVLHRGRTPMNRRMEKPHFCLYFIRRY